MYEIGAPAEWANNQKWKRRRTSTTHATKATAAILAAAAFATVMITMSPEDELINRIQLGAALIAVAVGMFYAAHETQKAKATWKRASQAKIGVTSERDTRKALRKERRTQPLIAAYGLLLNKRGGDLDLTIVTRNLAIAAVEIKTGFGKVSTQGNQIRAGKRTLPGDPLGQVARQANQLAQRIGHQQVYNVVCIPGMTNRPFITQGTLICNANDLSTAVADIANTPAFTSEQEALTTLKQLAQ